VLSDVCSEWQCIYGSARSSNMVKRMDGTLGAHLRGTHLTDVTSQGHCFWAPGAATPAEAG
jgi:hypothetical protein